MKIQTDTGSSIIARGYSRCEAPVFRKGSKAMVEYHIHWGASVLPETDQRAILALSEILATGGKMVVDMPFCSDVLSRWGTNFDTADSVRARIQALQSQGDKDLWCLWPTPPIVARLDDDGEGVRFLFFSTFGTHPTCVVAPDPVEIVWLIADVLRHRP